MKPTIKASLIAAAISLFPIGAYAAGLGQINVQSNLNEPLNAEIQLNATPQELQSLSARVAPPDAFLRANIPYASFVPNVRIVVENRGGRSVLKLTSTAPINEAVGSLIIELNWDDGKLSRTYNFLLDPADLAIRPPAPVEPIVARPTTPLVESAPTPPPSPVVQAPPPVVQAPPPVERTLEPVVPVEPEEELVPLVEEQTGEQPTIASEPERSPVRVEAPPPPPPVVAAPPPPPPVQRPVSSPYLEGTGGDYTVTYGDTLGDIANSRLPADVSLEQMMLALYRANPTAFNDKNINRLRAGVILKMPSESDMRSVSNTQARREVRVHARNFNAWRKELAEGTANAAARPVESGTGVTSTIDAVQQDVRPSGDRIEVGSSATVGGDAERLRKVQEDLAAADARRREAEDRVSQLEKINEDARKLIELRAKEVADLQAQLNKTKAAQAAAAEPPAPVPAPVIEPPAPVPAPEPVVEPPVIEQPVVEPPAPPPVDAAPPVEDVTPAEDALAREHSGEDEEIPEDPLAVVLRSMTDTQNLGIAAIVILLLGCFLGFRSWQRKRSDVGLDTLSQEATSMFPGEATSIFGDNGGQSVDTSSASSVIHTDFSQTGLSIDTNEGVDPVAEADVYMAYGRDSQAEEILNDALKADPKRGAIYVKLLEIYAQRQDLVQFETTASELFSRTDGQGRDWEKAAQMGRRLDPDNPLYSGRSPGQGSEETSKLPGLEPGIEEHTKLDLGVPTGSGQTLSDLDFGTSTSPASDASHLKETMVVRGGINDLLAANASGKTAQPRRPEPAQKPNQSVNVDFQLGAEEPSGKRNVDFDLGQSDRAAKSGKQPISVSSRQPAKSTTASRQPARSTTASRQPAKGKKDIAAPLEFDAPSQKQSNMTATVILPSVQGGDDHSEDVMLDLEKTSFDPNALDFDLDIDGLTPSPAPTRGARQPVMTAAETGDAGEIDTKLELARAYEDMGDTEGALELLREVVAEGNASQKAQARSLIDKLA